MSTMKTNRDNTASPSLALKLFGSLEAHIRGVPLARLHSRKDLWLLALLTLRKGKPIERDRLAGTLWPDSSQSQALAYLRQSLTELRHALTTEAARLQAPTRQTLLLDLAGADVDILTFDADIQKADPTAVQRAVAIYRGPLLEECAEEWVILERGNREQSYLTALQFLADDALAHGEMEAAISYARRAIGVDPLQEGIQRTLIQALASAGDYGAATQVYRDLRMYLYRELNAEPDPQTTALYNRLRAQTRQKAHAARKIASHLSTSPPPRRLPRPLTDLLGRDTEALQIAARLRQRRLVTLTGIGGVGKTRLAIAVAEAMVEEYADGVWFVELAGIADTRLLAQSIATTLGVRNEPRRSLQEALVSFLRSRLLLLVLDNCEHLLQACAQLVRELLQNCSGVRILATSRQTLGITGEVNWQVPLLPVPDLAHLPTEAADLLADVSNYASVQLFVERAEAMQKGFSLTTRNVLEIARICERLDGIPLAIELAAGNVRVLPIEQITHHLDDVFRLLTRGDRTAFPHQQTLQTTLDWSYDLLTEAERYVLQHLAVFRGGWPLEALEQVCANTQDDATAIPASVVEPVATLSVLTSLVDKSLVQIEAREDSIRYRLLETVRQYAADRLNASGKAQMAKCRHRDYFLVLAETAGPRLIGPDQALWFDRLETEHDNLRAALNWCFDADMTGVQGMKLASALSGFWTYRGYYAEGRDCLEQAITRYQSLGPHATVPAILPRAHTTLGTLYYRQSNYASAQQHYECALETFRRIGPPTWEAYLLRLLGNVAYDQGSLEAAQELYQASLVLVRNLGDRTSEAHLLDSIANVAHANGDYTHARKLREEALPLIRAAQDAVSLSVALHNLGNTARALGDFDAAFAWLDESLTIARDVGNKGTIASNLCHLAAIAMHHSDFESTTALLQESLHLSNELGHKSMIAELLEVYAELAARQEDLSRCARLSGAATALREQIGVPLSGADRARHDQVIRRVREKFGADYSAYYTAGRAMSLEQAYALALRS